MSAATVTRAPSFDTAQTTTRPVPAARPCCAACGRHLPTIDGYCAAHMSLTTEIALHVISPADLGLPGK